MRKTLTYICACCATALLLCVGCAGAAQSGQSHEPDGRFAKHPQIHSYTDSVKEYLQEPVLSGGCEVAALACVLEAMDFEFDIYDLVDNYLPMEDGSSFATSYMGSPYYFGSGYPPVLARCANSFFKEQESRLRAVSMSGCPFETLVDEVRHGRPVLVWTTMFMQPAMHTQVESDGYEWYDNEHCVVMYGIDDDGVKVMDPLEGLIVRDADDFQEIYEDCGSLAVVFYEVG